MKKKAVLVCFLAIGIILPLAYTKTSLANSEPNNREKVERSNKPKKAERRVVRIVFVGQKQACDCTRKRIETTWNIVRGVLKENPGISIKRIQRDVDVEETKKVAKLKAMMVAPGIYFIDKQDGLVELLQGEVTKKQVEKVIIRKSRRRNDENV